MSWYRIELPYAVFSIVVRGEHVWSAAPIGRWMVGRPLATIEHWVKRRGGSIQKLDDGPVSSVP
jgi:hypothetical protein